MPRLLARTPELLAGLAAVALLVGMLLPLSYYGSGTVYILRGYGPPPEYSYWESSLSADVHFAVLAGMTGVLAAARLAGLGGDRLRMALVLAAGGAAALAAPQSELWGERVGDANEGTLALLTAACVVLGCTALLIEAPRVLLSRPARVLLVAAGVAGPIVGFVSEYGATLYQSTSSYDVLLVAGSGAVVVLAIFAPGAGRAAVVAVAWCTSLALSLSLEPVIFAQRFDEPAGTVPWLQLLVLVPLGVAAVITALVSSRAPAEPAAT